MPTDPHVAGLTSICNWLPTDLLITHNTSNCLSTEEYKFYDHYSINYMGLLVFVQPLYCACWLTSSSAKIQELLLLQGRGKSKEQQITFWRSIIFTMPLSMVHVVKIPADDVQMTVYAIRWPDLINHSEFKSQILFHLKKKKTFDAPLNDTDIYSFGLASPIKGFPYMINRMSYDQTLMKWSTKRQEIRGHFFLSYFLNFIVTLTGMYILHRIMLR